MYFADCHGHPPDHTGDGIPAVDRFHRFPNLKPKLLQPAGLARGKAGPVNRYDRRSVIEGQMIERMGHAFGMAQLRLTSNREFNAWFVPVVPELIWNASEGALCQALSTSELTPESLSASM